MNTSEPPRERHARRTLGQLADAGLLAPAALPALAAVAQRYAVAITPTMAELIDRTDPHDPIARQFLPDEAELVRAPEEADDPIGDGAHSPVPGIVHRHADRVLLKLVTVCPVYCRFCFRRETVGPKPGAILARGALDRALGYIASHPDIWEVIMTGGDPFMVSARRAGTLTARLGAIPHVRVLRWHTRVPIVAPERVTPAFVRALKTSDRAVFVAVHANHPRELTPAARRACARLVDAGIPLMSQTVLLRGVNDDAATLEALMRGLVETRIKPYYLHQLDPAPGTRHFHTPPCEGLSLMAGLRARASGLCQPLYVQDGPDGASKRPVSGPPAAA